MRLSPHCATMNYWNGWKNIRLSPVSVYYICEFQEVKYLN